MGLFDWLTGKRSNVQLAADQIWLTDEAKLAGISTDVDRALDESDSSVALFLVLAGDTPADSIEKWFSLNCRELWREYYSKPTAE